MTDLMIWRPIPEFPNYEISDMGAIRIVKPFPNNRWGHGLGSYRKGYVLVPRKHNFGGMLYYTVRLTRNGKRYERRVNRLVCEVFHGPPPSNIHHAAHKDGDSLKNCSTNLYWATPQENIDDRERHGRTMRGDGHYHAKLSAKDIPIIRELWSAGLKQPEIARRFDVTAYAISDVVRRKSWKHIN